MLYVALWLSLPTAARAGEVQGAQVQPAQPTGGAAVSLSYLLDLGRGCRTAQRPARLRLNQRWIRYRRLRALGACKTPLGQVRVTVPLGRLEPGEYTITHVVEGAAPLTFSVGPWARRSPTASTAPAQPRPGDLVKLRFRVPIGSGCGVKTRRAHVRINRRKVPYTQKVGHGACDAFFGHDEVTVSLGRLRAGTYRIYGPFTPFLLVVASE